MWRLFNRGLIFLMVLYRITFALLSVCCELYEIRSFLNDQIECENF